MAGTRRRNAGLKVGCPKCGATEGLIVIVHDTSVECRECGEDVTREQLRQLADDALRLLAWLDSAGDFRPAPAADDPGPVGHNCTAALTHG